jgi:hypothetical protein
MKTLDIDDAAIDIHPGADVDLEHMNDWLRKQEGYLEGLKFTVAEKLDGHDVHYHYDYPASFTPEQQQQAQSLVQKVKKQLVNRVPSVARF